MFCSRYHGRSIFVAALADWLALVEEAIPTTMTNLAPLFGVPVGQAYITASTNYLDVVALHSVVMFVPFCVGWALILSRYDFTSSKHNAKKQLEFLTTRQVISFGEERTDLSEAASGGERRARRGAARTFWDLPCRDEGSSYRRPMQALGALLWRLGCAYAALCSIWTGWTGVAPDLPRVEKIATHLTVVRSSVNGVRIESNGKTLAIYGDPRDSSPPVDRVLLTDARRDVVWAARGLIGQGAVAVAPEKEAPLLAKPQEFWQHFEQARCAESRRKSRTGSFPRAGRSFGIQRKPSLP